MEDARVIGARFNDAVRIQPRICNELSARRAHVVRRDNHVIKRALIFLIRYTADERSLVKIHDALNIFI